METSTLIFRLVVAVVLSMLVGWEREYFGKPAGARTYALVTLGSTLFTILSMNFGDVSSSRIASNIVVGIGFIGAGSIMHQKEHTTGLTTAAGLWVASAMGMAVGLGMYMLAIAAAVLSLLILYGFGRLHNLEPHDNAR